MTEPKENLPVDARRLIAEANKTLTRLQGERIRELSISCLPAYGHLGRESGRQDRLGAFAIDPIIAQMLAGSFDLIDYTDSESAEEIDRVAESFAKQLRLYRKRLQNDLMCFYAIIMRTSARCVRYMSN